MSSNFNKLDEIAERFRQNQTRVMHAMAAQAVTFSKQRFREQAWTDNHTEPWHKRKPGALRGCELLSICIFVMINTANSYRVKTFKAV